MVANCWKAVYCLGCSIKKESQYWYSGTWEEIKNLLISFTIDWVNGLLFVSYQYIILVPFLSYARKSVQYQVNAGLNVAPDLNVNTYREADSISNMLECNILKAGTLAPTHMCVTGPLGWIKSPTVTKTHGNFPLSDDSQMRYTALGELPKYCREILNTYRSGHL